MQQLGFVLCHFQAKLCQSLRQNLIKALCIANQLKAAHKVIRIAAQCRVVSAMPFNRFFKPYIQRIMEVHIG